MLLDISLWTEEHLSVINEALQDIALSCVPVPILAYAESVAKHDALSTWCGVYIAVQRSRDIHFGRHVIR